jgi:hypothetical protein
MRGGVRGLAPDRGRFHLVAATLQRRDAIHAIDWNQSYAVLCKKVPAEIAFPARDLDRARRRAGRDAG